ncbi:hypothetical protein K0M31_010092 [Melipona bicolor]|uniref:Uncharacterized protein n=1 Tax=Melipona bicolor TaxID=60889 RepID=A0AA40KIS9_9HYME|nr:hypothetical protein K0M31_010092 [Melipona bicolor]
MGVVKTASESVLEEVVVPSEEANYSVQGHAGRLEGERKKRPRVRHSWLGSRTRNVGREEAAEFRAESRQEFKDDVASRPHELLTGV